MKDHRPLGPPVMGWTSASFPPTTPMDGAYARVAPFDLNAHAQTLFDLNSADHAIWDYLPDGPFSDFAAYRDFMAAKAQRADPMFHTIINKETGRPEGVAAYLRIAPAAGSIAVGYITYSPVLQNTRAGTEAMVLMMRRAFDLGYRRYELKCNALNAPSRKLAQRLGMSFEGIFRQAAVIKGRSRDTAWYAVIDTEWPALNTAFTQWLEPDNFDHYGRQRQRLSTLTAPLLATKG